MGDVSRKVDIDELVSYSNDLIGLLKDKRDINNLKQTREQKQQLQSSCDSDYNDVHRSIQDYQKKIDMCKQKTEETKHEGAIDAEIDFLQKELDGELQRERLLKDDLGVVTSEIDDLERQSVSVEERRQNLKKFEQNDLKAQMKLSMYASVTNIIPNLDDHSKISGHIVEREKNLVEKFEFDPTKVTDFDTCNSIWKTINM